MDTKRTCTRLRIVGAGSGRLAVVLCVLAALGVPARAQAPLNLLRSAGWQRFGQWRQAEGLPQESIFSLIQSRDGYLWMGTKGGLTRFDGVRFTTFDDRDPRQLRDNEVWSIAEARDGSIWAGTYGGGVSRHAGGSFTVFTTEQGLASDYVAVVCADPGGGMWVGTDRGLTLVQDGRASSFTTKEGLPGNVVRALHADDDGSLWIGTSKGGIARYRAGRLETVAFDGPSLSAEVRWFWRDGEGTMWIATYEGLARARDGRLWLYTTEHGLPTTRIRQVGGHPGGGLLIASEHGIDHIHWNGESPESRPIAGETSGMAFTLDHEGSLWVGTFIDGLQRLRQGLFANYSPAEGTGGYTAALIEDRAGAVWLGTRKGVNRLFEGRSETYGEESGLPKASVYALLEDAAGYLWVGTGSGVYRSRETPACPAGPRACRPRFTPLDIPSLGRPYVRVLFEDKDGGVWIGTDQEGMARHQHGAFTLYSVKEGLPNGSVRAVTQAPDGAIWIGTRGGGISHLKDGTFTTYAAKDGLVGDSVQALHMDAEGTLWIATRQGLSRLRDGQFTSYTVNDGLFANYSYSFIEDGGGHLWMGSAKGVSRVAKKDLEDVARGPRRPLAAEGYHFEHGLRGQPVAGSHPAAIRTRDGRLWFATSVGVSVIDPRSLRRNEHVPPVHVESVVIDEHERVPAGALEAGPGRGDVAFRYTALSFVAPEKVRFRYRLEGFDPHWVEAEGRRVAYYTNLPPGRYRFRVAASNNDGVWNERGADVEVRLRPYFHQTWWFYGLCVAAIGMAGAGTQRLRVRALKARERELSRHVEEALAHIKRLRGLLPICASCKKIRDDRGYWSQMEVYITQHSEADFSHSICPDCMKALYPDYADKVEREPAV